MQSAFSSEGDHSAYGPRITACADDAQRLDLRQVIERTVADVFDIEPRLLRLPTRGQYRIALARQVCMYVAHVACGMSLTDVGRMFERDRTTAAHACSVVEGRRDDADFNRALDLVELVVKVLSGPSLHGEPPPGL